MTVENNLYFNFKSYKHYQTKALQQKPKIKPRALLGSALGVGCAMLALTKVPQKKNSSADEIMRMLVTAGAANLGGVLFGSIGADGATKKKKYKEAAFQMMNTTIPMLMVGKFATIHPNLVKMHQKLLPLLPQWLLEHTLPQKLQI